MGCFLGCFRIKDDRSRRCHLFSNSCSWKKKEVLSDRKQYASVGSCEGKNSPCDKAGLENLEENFDADDTDYDKLRQEAKFLKTCGAILETPIEIRKASVLQSVASDPCCKTINWDQQLDSTDDFPTKAPEIVTFEEVKPKSCQREETDDTIKKVVRFQNSTVEKNTRVEESDISPEVECQMQAPGTIYGSGSPYPTPLNLIDGLQTPGTIYPPKSENFRTGRIKTQFVFGVPDPSRRSFELETKNTMDSREEQSHSDNSPRVDRPIIGTAAAHWSGEDSSRISPRQWDGNGIPNSTTKYKEDQRVSWHATPFEVRLDKALSDEKVYPQRFVSQYLIVMMPFLSFH
ncbi:hypothetical protein KSP39_PZI023785 [Platanthera zijinensis]|uniref:Uncharacterized protein n=1 Tax=Platanthera zijinensis TaxID=2320716 RepID=A0AAP0FSS2_9ASPA